MGMTLRLLLPGSILQVPSCSRIRGWAPFGSFTLLPRHLDGLMPLSSGLMCCTLDGGGETFLAVDQGLLVKRGADVTIVTPRAEQSDDLARLEAEVQAGLFARGEHERQARSAMAGLEANLVRGLHRLDGRLP